MNIMIFGAGAIGSLFGGLLSKNNKVVLVGRKEHVEAINKKSLKIRGLTNLDANVLAVENVKNLPFSPDIIIISVKSYDTSKAVESIKKIITKNTVVISLQNGLGNIEKIQKYVAEKQIVVCITTHGSVFLKHGCIKHTGIGKTIVGAVETNNKDDEKNISKILNDAGIETNVSTNILKDLWVKAIINSSINVLTSIFNCKNGYLLENPILENLVDKICEESTNVANAYGFNLSHKKMIKETKKVIEDTYENHSSMLQSLRRDKKTEIKEISGKIVKYADKSDIASSLNKIALELVDSF